MAIYNFGSLLIVSLNIIMTKQKVICARLITYTKELCKMTLFQQIMWFAFEGVLFASQNITNKRANIWDLQKYVFIRKGPPNKEIG